MAYLMFENSIAFTISPTREGHWRLNEFADRAGFSRIAPYKNIHLLAQQRGSLLPFCLIEGANELDYIRETITDIRTSPEVDICFMPVVLLTDETDRNFISGCIGAGFDDIIALPCRMIDFAARVKLQMENQLDYFKTSSYFGPDRRRGKANVNHPDRRGGRGFDYEKYVIRRNRRSGVKILSHQKFSASDIMSMLA